MSNKSFQVGGWSSNDVLGFSILKGGLQYFPKGLPEVRLWLPRKKEVVIVNLRQRQDTFWTTCSELANKETTKWLLDNGYKKYGAKWKWRKPPRFTLTQISRGEFKLTE